MIQTQFYGRIKEISQQVVASGLIYVNSNAKDFTSDEIRPYLDKYVRGSNGIEALDRIKIMKLLWDATGSALAAQGLEFDMLVAESEMLTLTSASPSHPPPPPLSN